MDFAQFFVLFESARLQTVRWGKNYNCMFCSGVLF